MTAIIQFFTSHFFGNMVYGIINNLITFIFVWFIHAFIPYKPKYQSRKNLTRATLLLYIGLVIISYLREVPGNNAIPIFYLLMALSFSWSICLRYLTAASRCGCCCSLWKKSLKYWEWQFRRLCLYG